ncbi:hypothetical protein ES319_A11G313100v1, partial [Gossypium barbadense]
MSYLKFFDVSKNQLTDQIPLSIRDLSSLEFFDVSGNDLNGTFPPCFGQLKSLFDSLNLSYNQLRGEVSYLNVTFCIDLSSNHFIGPSPRLVSNLRYLFLSRIQALDIDTNLFIGEIPDCWNHWGSLANLNLGSNNLTGKIPPSLGHKNLLVLNLRNNSMFGELPSTLQNYTRFIMLDLSENHFNSLNFSGNLRTGNIPDNIGNMELMESLDLSMNRLNGEIPSSFSNLYFLNHFNVSYNNLTGQIPTSTQLQSFENLSYVGNHLYEPPLTKNYTTKGIPTDAANNGSNREGSKVNWLYVSIVLGFVLRFWGVMAPFFFIRSWRIAYYQKLDHTCGKLYVLLATMG